MRVLYTTDGSEGALSAARFLAGFAHRRDTHVHIVTFLGDEDDAAGEAILEATRAAIGDFAGHVTTAAGRVLCGASEVVELTGMTAKEIGADLVVVGSRGLSPIARFLLGSVAEGVARYAPCPVLLARPTRGASLDRVIVGIDGSDASQEAAVWVGEHLPLPPGCEVQLTAVVSPARAAAGIGPDIPFVDLDERLADAAEAERSQIGQALDRAAGVLEGRGWNVSRQARPAAGEADGLIDAATYAAADLVVVGARGQSAIERVLLGSVSERVLHYAPCSVLIVRSK
jgi:nucleotide-binding universal stress UspA family protein